jgi:hypothetical protein
VKHSVKTQYLIVLIALIGMVMVFMGSRGWTANGIGFDLSHCLVDKNELRSGGPPKDGIPALTDPQTVAAGRARFLRPEDRVVGVSLGDESRAYPLAVLTWHEAINDTLGGEPIVVTYCPLCDSSLVFSRKAGGSVREFGVSGYLYQSNVVLYDRQRRSEQESLWSQVAMKAICGPAARAGLELELLDSVVTSWADWRRRQPDSSVVSFETGHRRAYRQPAYADYFASDRLMFPVTGRMGRRPDLKNKDQVLVLEVGGSLKAYPYADLARDTDGVIEDEVGGAALTLRYHPESRRVDVEQPGGGAPVKRSTMFWFAYDVFYPHSPVYSPAAATSPAH